MRTLRAAAAAALLAAACPLLAGFPGTDVFIPAVARAPGLFGAQFYSTVWVTNLSASPVSLQVLFYVRNASNTAPAAFDDTLAPGETKRYDNAVETLFGTTGAGALRFRSSGDVFVSSRTYSLPASGKLEDSVGLFFSAVPASFAIGAGETASLQGVSQGGPENFRYNAGFVETEGQPANVHVVLRDALGAAIAAKDYFLQASQQAQFSVGDLGAGTANGRLEATVTSGAGRVILFGTQIANGSNDSAGFEMSFARSLLPSGPAVKSLNGLSDAVILAAGPNVSLATLGNTITISATSSAIADNSVTTAKLADASVTAAKISPAGAASGQALTYNGSSVVWQTPNGLTLPFSGGTLNATYAFKVNNTGSGFAINGSTTGGGVGNGVLGVSDGAGVGVYGQSATGNGVYALSVGGSGNGILAVADGSGAGAAGTGKTGPGVIGQSSSGIGVRGVSTGSYGVSGESTMTDGVHGKSSLHDGLAGESTSGSGVFGLGYYGVFGKWNLGISGLAGRFDGPVDVKGTLTKSGGSFRIDHPVDPEGKLLYHSFVESPDMKNVYDGVAVLDAKGEAAVELPDWFEALNKDFRYQLTAIGGAAPELHIAQKISGNRFRIAGGKPFLEVSWQVTGTRQDAWANAHRIPVEVSKAPNARGYYIHPELYGQPEEKEIGWAENPELMRRIQELERRIAAERRD